MELTREQLLARIAELEKANTPDVSAVFKVSDKGAVSVYTLGRFPVTLYATQWDKLIKLIPPLQEFIVANHDKLATKPVADKADPVTLAQTKATASIKRQLAEIEKNPDFVLDGTFQAELMPEAQLNTYRQMKAFVNGK